MGTILKFSEHTSPRYNMEMAKLMKNHVIIVGIGNIGLKLLTKLIEEETEDIVVIDKDEDSTKDDIIEEYRRKQQIELARDKKNSVESLTPEIINIASNYDLSTTIMEEEELWVLLFTYNSPKNLDLNEMDYLDELFDIATLELRNLLDRAEICVLN